MALIANTIRPVQRFVEAKFDLAISTGLRLQNSSPATQKSREEQDQKEEQQHLGDQGRCCRQNCKAENSADKRDDQEHECVVEHAVPLVFEQRKFYSRANRGLNC